MGVVRSAKKNENDEGGNGRGWAGREKTRGGWDVFLIGRGAGWGKEEILGGGGLFKKKKTGFQRQVLRPSLADGESCRRSFVDAEDRPADLFWSRVHGPVAGLRGGIAGTSVVVLWDGR